MSALRRGDTVEHLDSGALGRVVKVPKHTWEGQRHYPVTVWWATAPRGLERTVLKASQLVKKES